MTAVPSPAIDPETIEAAVLAVSRHEWEPSTPWTSHAGHSQSASCQVCQGNIAAILTVAAPVLLSEHREQIANEILAAANARTERACADGSDLDAVGRDDELKYAWGMKVAAAVARGSRLSDSPEGNK